MKIGVAIALALLYFFASGSHMGNTCAVSAMLPDWLTVSGPWISTRSIAGAALPQLITLSSAAL